MPRSRTDLPPSILPDREQQICARFREVRQDHRFKQAQFAEILSISVGRLKSYEYARAPIKYGLAKRLIEEISVDPDWLATGEGEKYSRVSIAVEYDFWIPAKLLYSFVHERLLRDILTEERAISTEIGHRRRAAGSQEEGPPLPSGADQTTVLKSLADVICRTFEDYCGGLNELNTLAVIKRIEKIIGPIDPTGWDTITEGLRSKANRKEEHTVMEIKSVVFEKLNLSMDSYRDLNVSEAFEQHEDQLLESQKHLTEIRTARAAGQVIPD